MATDTPASRGVVASDPQNQADPKGIHTRSFFSEQDLGYDFFASLPFGEVRPFSFFETVPDDKRIRAQFKTQVMSYTLKSRLMQDIHMKKLLVQVPREAILPLNWNKWFKNPVIGQDVPSDVGTSVAGFWHLVSDLMSAHWTSIDTAWSTTSISTSTGVSNFLTALFRYFLMAELFYSDGNLLKFCLISGRPWASAVKADGHTRVGVDYVFDKFCDSFLTLITGPGWSGSNLFDITFANGQSYVVDPSIDSSKANSGTYISFREALSLMREDLTFSISRTWTSDQITAIDGLRSGFFNDVEYYITFYDDNPTDPADRVAVDLKRLWAYQLAYFHFLTNDSVDFLFSAELYRQYIYQLSSRWLGSTVSSAHRFTVNGLEYQYDYLSSHYFAVQIAALTSYYTNGTWPSGSPNPDSFNDSLAYFTALFGFNRSLRYLDYFTGSKTRPLAVGDVTVQVNNNTVNVVDTQAKTFLARFLNVINRVGMRNYVKGVFGTEQAPDWHNPQYLVQIDDIVYGQQVENTGAQQFDPDFPNSITTLLHGNSDRYAFEIDFDRSSIIVGLVWFDIDRVYSMATERQNLHFDRFDEFQPFMQYTGDQALMRVELGSPLLGAGPAVTPATAPFGYKLRNAEYKERYDQCAGAFCNDMLDAFLFKADILESSGIQNIDPMFIRSFPSELDRFYLSLTGYSLGTYFHFIVKFTNLYSGSRPMAFAPTLM